MNSGFGIDPIPGLSRLTPDNAKLLLLNGPAAASRFPLHRIRSLIGRNDLPLITVDIDLTECEIGDPIAISRRHAVIEWVEGELQIVDLCSRNGTFVDGQKLTAIAPNQPSAPVILKAGSKVKLGNLEFEVITHG